MSSPARGRALAWAALIVALILVERLADAALPPTRMLLLVATTFLGMKAIVLVEHGAASGTPLACTNAALFVLGWPGMRPAAFAQRSSTHRRGAAASLRAGSGALAAGLVLVLCARAFALRGGPLWIATMPLLVGLSLLLHFGLFRLLHAGWRARGFPVELLFRAPWRARGLGEFWARRWNLAFSQMTTLAVARPARGALGLRGATLLGFLVSGLLHEVAISLPVRAGFGLPTLYFALHGALVLRERRPRPARTLAALVLPLPLLFHEPFMCEVIWPLVGVSTI